MPSACRCLCVVLGTALVASPVFSAVSAPVGVDSDGDAEIEKEESVFDLSDIFTELHICRKARHRGRQGAVEVETDSAVGNVHFREQWYNKDWFQNLQNSFYHKSGELRTGIGARRTLALFGDNEMEWCRKSGTNRGMSAAQASALSLSQMDRTIAYGIVTTCFVDRELCRDFALFKQVIDQQFDELQTELLRGAHIIVPTPAGGSQLLKAKDGNHTAIHHSLGTGIANLPLTHLLHIEARVQRLLQLANDNRGQVADECQAAAAAAVIGDNDADDGDVVYDAYDDDFHICRIGDESFDGRLGAIPVPVETDKRRLVPSEITIFASTYFERIENAFYNSSTNELKALDKRRGLILFSDSDVEHCRGSEEPRGTTTEAKFRALSHSFTDRTVAYGIVTRCFHDVELCANECAFKRMIDWQFDDIEAEFLKGAPIVIPTPKDGSTRLSDGTVIHHCLGTDKNVDALPISHLQIIEERVQRLLALAK